MELHDHEPLGENDTLARHNRLAEVIKGERLLQWSDLETFIYDSHCLSLQGKQVAVWSIVFDHVHGAHAHFVWCVKEPGSGVGRRV